MGGDRKRVPELRFKGFSGDWEQRKLEKLAKFEKGKGYSKSDLVEHGFRVILYGRLYTNYETVIETIDTYVNSDNNSIRSKVGDVIVPASGESSEDIARASVVPYSGIILGGDLNIIESDKNKINPIFLALAISNGKQKKELSRRAQGKSIVHLRNIDLKEVSLNYPSLNEQNQIGNLLKKIDDTIALHQRKLDKITELRKGYTQKMFPLNEEFIPVMRFTNFNTHWEQRKLGEVLSIPEKEKITNMNDLKLMTLSLNNGGIKLSPSRETLSIGSTNYYKRKSGQLLYGKQNFFNGSMAIIPKEADGYATSTDVPALNINVDKVTTDYLIQYISRPDYYKHKETHASGTGSKRIHEKTLFTFDISTPTLGEQAKIGNFFEQLDEIIALHQLRLEKIQSLKKFYLQKMFI